MCVEKEPNHYKPGILKNTAVKTHKTRIMKTNYLTENTFLLQNKGQLIEVV